jgi:hypothetical protein
MSTTKKKARRNSKGSVDDIATALAPTEENSPEVMKKSKAAKARKNSKESAEINSKEQQQNDLSSVDTNNSKRRKVDLSQNADNTGASEILNSTELLKDPLTNESAIEISTMVTRYVYYFLKPIF